MPRKMRLTENDRKVLRKLIGQGRVNDTKISEEMPISQQAVFQIRTRLEDTGIIKGYMPIIDFEKIGIKTLNFVGIKVQPELWKDMSEGEMNQKFYEIPFLFMAFRLPSDDLSYILIIGFKDIDEEERFASNLEIKLANKIKMVWNYRTSVKNMIAYDSLNLVYHALSKDSTNIKEKKKKISSK